MGRLGAFGSISFFEGNSADVSVLFSCLHPKTSTNSKDRNVVVKVGRTDFINAFFSKLLVKSVSFKILNFF